MAGEDGLKAMRGYQYAATRLALLRDGVLRGLDTGPADLARVAAEERRLLETISALRQVFTGRDPQAPVGIWDGHRYHLDFPDGVRRSLDAPDDPVVPIPVVLTSAPYAPPPPPHAAGWPGQSPYAGPGQSPYPGPGQPPYGR